MEFDDNLLKNIKGFLDEEEGRYLYEAAKQASKFGPCLEIGSYCGKSAIYLGKACKENDSVLFTIDHHKGSEEQQPGEEYFDADLFDEKNNRIDTFPFLRKAIVKAGLEDTVIPMICRSEVAARKWATPLSMVFIDGGHAYETVFIDYVSWSGHIVPDGYLIFHDIFLDPEKGGQAPYNVYKLAISSGLFRALPMFKTLGILRRLRCGEVLH